MNKLLIIILLGFISFGAVSKAKYFEGVVEYDLSYKPIHKNATIDFLEQNYGVKEFMYYKNGFYKKVKLNKEGDTVSVIIHNPRLKKIYGTHVSSGDTIMTYSTLENVMKSYNMKELKKTVVNGKKVNRVELHLVLKDEFAFDEYRTQNTKYYFSKKYKINPNNHKDQMDGFYNEMVNSYPYLVLKMILNDGYIKEETKVFTKIERKIIDDNTFVIDDSKPIKEI
ncbi:hypothetical protein [Psychroserpens sp.]